MIALFLVWAQAIGHKVLKQEDIMFPAQANTHYLEYVLNDDTISLV